MSQNAAEARAKNQGLGRGLGGLILGSKYRASQRSQAARINASIAKQVAEKRGQIEEGKREAQALVRRLQAELTLTKEEFRSLAALAKAKNKDKAIIQSETFDSVELLKKLKDCNGPQKLDTTLRGRIMNQERGPECRGNAEVSVRSSRRKLCWN